MHTDGLAFYAFVSNVLSEVNYVLYCVCLELYIGLYVVVGGYWIICCNVGYKLSLCWIIYLSISIFQMQ